MLRLTICRLSGSASVASGAPATAAAVAASSVDRRTLVESFAQWVSKAGVRLGDCGVKLNLSDADSRGLVATKSFREGVRVLSVPMGPCALSAERLLRTSEFVQKLKPPTYDEVRVELNMHSVRDTMLFQQMHFALLLAAERMNPNSMYAPYFEVLPHPAVDDQAVMGLHKDVLDPMQLIEWDDHQRLFLTAIRGLTASWGRRSDMVPPVSVCYWAFRTVLSRMHLLPDRGLTPGDIGSSLHYSAYSTLQQVEAQESIVKRLKSTFSALMRSDSDAATDFRLVPTLIPLIDMTPHLSSGNVSVEVQPRPGFGSCVELQAVAPIQEGETIGMCFNRSQSVAFTLYRFGFLPI